MRVTRESATNNRRRIVSKASALFRKFGFDGLGIAPLMAACGLTHGGFYHNFASKDDLIAEASAHALEENLARWREELASSNDNPAAAIASFYLSAAHVGSLEQGCAIAGLGADAARKGDKVTSVYFDGIEKLVGLLADAMPQENAADRRQEALLATSLMVGALVLARAAGDPKLAGEIQDLVTARLRGAK